MTTSLAPRRAAVIVFVLAAAASLLAGVWMSRNAAPPWGASTAGDGVSATVLDPPKPVEPFQLIDHTGTTLDLARLRDRWSFLFFGYTHCPDVCPTTLATLARAIERLPAATSLPPQVVFVSIDPERDTVERLAQYAPFFHRSFIGATGPETQLEKLTRQLGILYLKAEPNAGGGYLVDHSASILLINPRAELRAVFSPPFDAEAIRDDYLALRERDS